MFKRTHHQRIANVLTQLNADLFRRYHCYFAGGTAITLRFGEYRESVDIDFMVSDPESYSELRHIAKEGFAGFFRSESAPLRDVGQVRIDQYGIRTRLAVEDSTIKFEIIREGRIIFDDPEISDQICGVSTATVKDLAASKLLANSDRWADAGVFNRDLIDLAMMDPDLNLLRHATDKAERAYGKSVKSDLGAAITRIQAKPEILDHCIVAMCIDVPKALLWQRIRKLRRIL